jgi:hypothetical protein
MEPANFARALRNFCRRKRFFPFFVQLTSGDTFLIFHPEALVIRDGLAMLVRKDGGYRVFDSTSVCQLYDQPLRPPPGSSGASGGPSSEDQT